MTPYGQKGLLGGVSEQKIDRGIYRVSAEGNGYTSHKRVEAMALYRASELTLAAGYERFLLLPDDEATRTVEKSRQLRKLAMVGKRTGMEGLSSIGTRYTYVPLSTGAAVPIATAGGSVIVVMLPAGSKAGIGAKATIERLKPVIDS